jgi:murein L,D-transpeptidase YafK
MTSCVLLLSATAGGTHGQLARDLGLLPAEAIGAPVVAALPTGTAFALEQLRHERVREARLATRHNIKRLFHERGISYPAAEIFMRIFKRERSLELWVRAQGAERFELLKTYSVCAMAGELGPKRRQGDNQTPEGFYQISWFNPRSEFHLSLHLDYPNRRDRAAAQEGTRLGGDIFIHGGCRSEGCLAITDDGIRELYWLSVEARAGGQHRIPVHVFPARLGDGDLELLRRAFATRPDLVGFWETLKPGYDFFEAHRRLPAIAVNDRAEYVVNGAAADQPLRMAQPQGAPTRGAAGSRPANARPTPAPLGTPVGTPAGTPAGTPVDTPLGKPVGGTGGGTGGD